MPRRLGSAEVIRVLQTHGLFLSPKREAIANIVMPVVIWPLFRIPKKNSLTAQLEPSSGNQVSPEVILGFRAVIV